MELNKESTFIQQNFPVYHLAITHHKTHKNKPIRFHKYRYLLDIYNDKSNYIVVEKSTQSGLSEMLVVYAISKAVQGRSVFYVLPTFSLVSRFVRNRIDRSVNFSPYYSSLLGQVKKQSESTSLKHFGKGAIAFVGSNTSTVFTEYPADDLIIDELDQCNIENIAMAEERLSASEDKRKIFVSNPTIEGYGIDEEYSKSDMKQWWIRCPHCNTYIQPDFFKHVVKDVGEGNYVIIDSKWNKEMSRDVNCICYKCGKPFDRYSDGKWIARQKSDISGYTVSKLFSANVSVKELLIRFQDGLTNPIKLQRFYNGDIGQAYTSKGAKVTKAMIMANERDYNILTSLEDGSCIAGVDVGTVLHVVISKIVDENRIKLVWYGELAGYMDLKQKCLDFKVRFGIIDALPEQRLSKRVCANIKGFFRCFYGSGKGDSINDNDCVLTVNRTESLDAVMELIAMEQLFFPTGISNDQDFMNQMSASTRILNDKDVYEWTKTSKADHYFHAMAYMIKARKLYLMTR